MNNLNNDVNNAIDKSQHHFSDNLNLIMKNKNINQKDFSKMTQIAPSTLSGYLKDKPPKYSFLITLKTLFPDINIDDLLFSTIQFENNENDSSTAPMPLTRPDKYFGSYYIYYINTSKRTLRIESEKNGHPLSNLNYAILYIDNYIDSKGEIKCSALFGIENRQTAKEIKDSLDSCTSYESVYKFLKSQHSYNIYTGSLHVSQHLFLSLSKTTDTNNQLLIILHNAKSHNTKYFGGLGTINSTSTGRESEPIVQLVALSRHYAYISEEQIKSQLWFAHPEINVKNSFAAKEILHLIKVLYSDISNDKDNSKHLTLSEKNIETLIGSYIEYLITTTLENTRFWYGRVSEQNDDDWYHLLSEAKPSHTDNL